MPPLGVLLLWLHCGCVGAAGAYALLKERAELGCAGFAVHGRQCRDEESVYVRGTEPHVGDDANTAARKLQSVLSYHEKAGVWKRSFLMAVALTYATHVVLRAAACTTPGWALATLHLLFLAIIYFYWNFINYHHFRVLKTHGMKHVAVLLNASR